MQKITSFLIRDSKRTTFNILKEESQKYNFSHKRRIKIKKLLTAISLVFKDLREARGLSQIQLNDEFKLKKTLTINAGRIEGGNTNISVSILYELSHFFALSLSAFIKLVEEKDPTLNINEIQATFSDGK